MQDRPDPAEILAAVADFLRGEVLPALDGRLAFDLRVSIGALELAGRQLALAPASDAAEAARLDALLGPGGTLETGNRDLAAAIAEGRLGLDTPGLIDHLRRTAIEKLAVDQPRYAGLHRALNQGA
ncbi:DUF6285 domain-containing protein [Zavarzinia sp.]|uniref:DUF6285 domain-containing protein n=1 Tax=Zavarzinia sp. TaxID=2027920 RepID=UPI0035651332